MLILTLTSSPRCAEGIICMILLTYAELIGKQPPAIPDGRVLADNGKNCGDTCSDHGKVCDAEKQTEDMNDGAKLAAAFKKVGVTCTSTDEGRAYAGTPFFVATPDKTKRTGYCQPLTIGAMSVCDKNHNPHHSPLCYCKA